VSYEEFRKIKLEILEKQQEIFEIEQKIKSLKEASQILDNSRVIQGLAGVSAETRVSDTNIIYSQMR